MQLCLLQVSEAIMPIVSHQHWMPKRELNSSNNRGQAGVHTGKPRRPHLHTRNYKQLRNAESQRNRSFQERAHALVI